MLFTNLTQFAVLGLMLIIGWLFGFASNSGGKKWKRAYRDEKAARAEAERRLSDSEQRVAELERAPAMVAARDHDTPATRDAAVAASAASPAFPEPETPAKRGWFDWHRGDDLTTLRGVDRDIAHRLHAERVDRFADIADLTDQDEIALERRLDLPAGYIQREQLRDQARLLADGRTGEWTSRFG